MEYTLLGRTGVRVSRLALGTATFGVAPQEHEAIELVHRALDLGINFFDTAVTYGNQPRFDRPGAPPAHQSKSAEEILGMALRGTATMSSLPARCRSASSWALTAAVLTVAA